MQIYHFMCKGCGYEARLPLGSSDLDQVLTDVNGDYAEYRLFRCQVELKFVHVDIHDKGFEDNCPSDGSKLIEIDIENRPIKCPQCNKDLVTGVSAPLQALA